MKAGPVYARLGWRIIPVEPNGKRPILADWPARASNDNATVTEWIRQHPTANIGVACGAASGFFCLDVDGDHGRASLEALERTNSPLPRTVQARTGSGGAHYLFKLPNFPIGNSASKLGPGLDIRGTGGQIVVSPSRTPKGSYTWVNPPWSTEIADAPEWLLAKIRPALQPFKPGPSRFPPASTKLLEAARHALEEHGPAIEGQGGDEHTFVAAAILINDFALTPAEAYEILAAWNETCEPSWGEYELRAKLDGAGQYAKRAYGSARSVDAVDAVDDLITAWLATGKGRAEMFAMLETVRDLVRVCGDTAKKAVIVRNLQEATGFTPKELGLPNPKIISREGVPEGAVRVSPRIHEVANEATAAISDDVFQRNGRLVEVIHGNTLTFIAELETPRIQDLMSASAQWVRIDEKGITEQAPPLPIASILHSRRQHVGIRFLDAVTTAPIFLADGSILSAKGYNEQARVYLNPSVTVDVLENPKLEHAKAAVALFEDLLCDFRFYAKEDFSSWLAGLLSPLVKAATKNAPAPLICVSASTPGAGKTLLTDVVARIINGGATEVRPYNPRDENEWAKKLTAFVKAAAPVSVFDNANGPIGDEGLDRLITSSTWSDRILGASDAPPLPNVTTWWATGNNIEPVGDTVRRVLLVRVDVRDERPQERDDFKRKELLAHVEENRAALLSAALTILRAFHVAGRPAQTLPTWGSFNEWSKLIRGALVWAGLPDPYLTQKRASAELNEPDNEAHDFWISVVDDSDGRALSIATLAEQRNARDVLSLRDQVTAYNLRKFLARFIDKPRAGRRIRKEKSQYYVEALT